MEKKILTNFDINNLFAEFIVNKLGNNYLSQIEVVDFKNFIVIKGKTKSKEILELTKIKSEFTDSFSSPEIGISIGNTIDLIEYDIDITPPSKLSFTFYNTTDVSKQDCETEKISLVSKSEFPYGYSYGMGKTNYYYAKKLVYNLQSKYQWDKITIEFPHPFNENDFNIFVDSCSASNESIKSALLDAFDFNFTGFNKKLEKLDWSKPILEKGYEFELLKELNENLILI